MKTTIPKEKKSYIDHIISYVWDEIKQKNYSTALNSLSSLDTTFLSENEIERYLYAMGRCLQGLHQIDAAIDVYLSINNWEYKNFIKRSLFLCYGEMEKNDAFFVFHRAQQYLDMGFPEKTLQLLNIFQAKYDDRASLCLARCYEALGEEKSFVQSHYNSIIKKWPKFSDAYFYRCRFLFNIGDINAKIELEAAMNKWPKSTLLKALKNIYCPDTPSPTAAKVNKLALFPRFFDLKESVLTEKLDLRALDLAQPKMRAG